MQKIVFIIACGLLFSAVGCSSKPAEAEEQQKVKVVNVETAPITPQKFESYLRLIGTVESTNDVKLSAEVSGQIEQYYVEKGEFVQKGEAILKIDDSRLRKQVAKLKVQTVRTREKYQRLKHIFKQDSIGSEMGVIKARTIYQESKAALEALQIKLQETTVRAPFTGVVDKKLAEVGEMAVPSMPLVRLISTEDLKISAGVPSRFSNEVKTGNMAKVWFDFQLGDTLRLPVTYVSQSIEPESRTFEIEIALPSKGNSYKVDMSANVKLQTLLKDSVAVIGREYLYSENENYFVYTVGQDSAGRTIALRTPVIPGASFRNSLVVKSGLQFGEHIITVGSSFLQDSMRVNIRATREG